MSKLTKVYKNGRWVSAEEPRVVDDPSCVAWWDARYYDPAIDSLVDMSGNGHHARFGSVGGESAKAAAIFQDATGKYLSLPGTLGNTARLSGPAPFGSTVDARVRVRNDDWGIPTASQYPLGYYGTNMSYRNWVLGISSSSGRVVWYWPSDASTMVWSSFDAPGAIGSALGLASGDAVWLRVTHDTGIGQLKLYWAPGEQDEPSSWTLLQTINVAVGNRYVGELATLEVGCSLFAASPGLDVLRAQVYDGIEGSGGTLVADFNPNNDTSPYGLGPVPDLSTTAHIKDSEYLSLPGTAGNYASTPDSAALGITGDIDLRVHATLASWASGSYQALLTKWANGAAGNSYGLRMESTGKISAHLADGDSSNAYLSPVAVPFAAGESGWVRFTNDVSTQTLAFYTSTDGVTWTALGAPVLSPGITGSLAVSASALHVGATDGTLQPPTGFIHRAQVYDGIDGTLVADFDPSRATSETGPVTSATGEVWTINHTPTALWTLSRSAADTNDPLLLPYEGEKYLYLPGVVGNHALASGVAALSTISTLEYRARVSFPTNPPGGSQHPVCGWQSTHAQLVVGATGTLLIKGLASGSVFVGESSSSPEVVPFTPNQPVWVRAKLTYATAQCEYWYSLDDTNDPDAVTWTALITKTGSNAGVAPVLTNSATPLAGSYSAGAAGMAGNLYVASEIVDGVERWRFDASRSVEPHTSVSSATGETWTINRTPTGRKAALVDRPLLLFGTDDRLEVTHHADLDFTAASDSGTVVALYRHHGMPTTSGIIGKKSGLGDGAAGWLLWHNNSNNNTYFRTGDGGAGDAQNISGEALPAGASRQIAGVTVPGTSTQTHYWEGVQKGIGVNPKAAPNTEPVRIGVVGSTYADMEFIGAAIFHKALTESELIRVAQEFDIQKESIFFLISPNGTKYKVSIDDTGALETSVSS